jgi:hypothetical protein
MMQSLKDAGCDGVMIKQYLQAKPVEQLRILTGYRSALLEKLHTKQKQLDCLDYLIYMMKKQTR